MSIERRFLDVSGSINSPGDQQIFGFEGSSGQKIFLDGLSVDTNIRVQLVSPSGNVVADLTSINSDVGPLTLFEDGIYQVVVAGNGNATGSFNADLIFIDSVELINFGIPIQADLDTGFQTDIYRLNGTAGQILEFDSLFASTGATWQLFGPDNQSISSSLLLTNDFEVTLPTDGEYLLVVDGNSNSTQLGYNFQVNLLGAATGTPSGFNTVETGDITAGEIDTFTFNAPSGLLVYFDNQDPNSSSLNFRLLDPNGNQIFFNSGGTSDTGPIVLPENGTYTLEIQGDNTTSTGSYQFNFLAFSDGATPLALDTPVTDTLDTGRAVQVFTFEGSSGQQLYYDALQNDPDNINVQLIGPSGNSIFSQSSESDRQLFTLTESGDYYLLLQGNQDSGLSDFSFQILDVANATDVSLDTTVNGVTLSPGREADLYRFTGSAGQELFFDSLSASGSGNWQLFGPGGQSLSSNFSLSSDFGVTLPADGEYILRVSGNTDTAIDYSFEILTPEQTTTALTLNTPVANTIDEVGEEDVYTFTGTAGQQLYFDSLETDFSDTINARLVSPSGVVLFNNFNPESDLQLFTLVEDGVYQLIIDSNGDTGDYNFQLLDAANATDVSVDTVVDGATLTPGRETDLYRFTGSAGQELFFDSLSASGSANWQLFGPGGQSLSSNFSLSSDFGVTLPTDGEYLLRVTGNSNTAIDYSFEIITPEQTTTALTLNTPVSNTINEVGEEDIYTFTGTAGQQLYFDSLETDFSDTINARLVSPSGVVLFNNFNPESDLQLFTLVEDGVYQLIIDSNGDTGDYNFQLLDATNAINVSFGTAVNGATLSPGRETDLYQFTGSAGQELFFDSLSVSGSANWQLFGPGGQSLSSNFSLSSDFGVTLPTDGEYLLRVTGNSNTEVPYDFQVNLLGSATGNPTGFNRVETGNITAGEIDTFTFNAPSGLLVYFDNQDPNSSSLNFRLLDPNGNQIFFNSGGTSDTGPIVLPENGTYTLEIQGDNTTSTGSYQFNFLAFSDGATPLTLDTPVTDTLDTGRAVQVFTFEGSSGQQLYYDALQNDPDNINVQLIGPSGNSIFSQSSESDRQLFTLTESGDYYLLLQGNQDSGLSDFSFQLLDVANATDVSLDTTVNGVTLTPGRETDLYRFTGSAGQELFFDSLSTSGSANWQLFGPGGQSLSSNFSLSSDFGVTLPADGEYILRVSGNTDAAIDYSFEIITPEQTTTALTLNTPVSNTIDEVGEEDVYTFTGTAGQQLYFDSLETDFSDTINARLVSPSGVVLFNNFNPESDLQLFTLVEDGVYQLIIDSNGDTGDYNFQLLDAANATDVSIDTVIDGATLSPGRETDLYRFTGSAGQELFFDSLSASGSANWQLFGPGGQSLSSNFSLGSDFGVTLPTDGEYLLRVTGNSNTDVPYSIEISTSETVTSPVSVDSFVVQEEDSGTTSLRFNVTLTDPIIQPLTLTYGTADGTATSGSDYIATSGTLTFVPDGPRTQNVTVQVNGDTVGERDETFFLNVTGGNSDVFVDTQGSVLIENDDLIPVDLELSLLIDVSGSVDDTEYELQIEGYAQAFEDPDLFNTLIAEGVEGQIAVNVILWASGTQQAESIGWTLIDSVESSQAFADSIRTTLLPDFGGSRPFSGGTSPGPAIDFAVPLFFTNEFDGTRQTIDISGDGSGNTTVSQQARDDALAAGVESINGIVIGGSSSVLTFYQNNLIGGVNSSGSSAFVLSAETFAEFGDIIQQKLEAELTPPPNLIINDVAVIEGNAGTTDLLFTVSLSDASEQTITVDYTTVDGSATEGQDYSAASGTLSFAPGVTSLPISVSIAGDTQVELDEIFFVNLSNATNADIRDTQGQGTIIDDDSIIDHQLAAELSSVLEGDTGTTQITYTITRSGAIDSASSIDFNIGGSAIAGIDFIFIGVEGSGVSVSNNTIIFGANATTATVTIEVIGDRIDEFDETIDITLDNAFAFNELAIATISGSPASTTVVDDDIAGIIVTPTSNLETTETGGTDTFTVVLNSQPTSNVTLTLNSSDLTEGTVSASSLTFTPEDFDIPQEVTVTGVDDNDFDGDINYSILTTPASSQDPNYSGLDPADVEVTNLDDEPPQNITYSLSAGVPSVIEGDSGSTTITFTVIRSGDIQGASSVDFGFSGSAEATEDFTFVGVSGTGSVGGSEGGVINFAPGETVATITLDVLGDNVDELNEDIIVTLSNATASGTATIDGSPASTAIIDDDTAGITITPTSGLETSEAGGTDTFLVVLDSQPTANVTLALDSSDITEGTASPDSLIFTPENYDLPQEVTIIGVDDSIDDGDVDYSIITEPAVSTDENYSGLNADDVGVTNIDDDELLVGTSRRDRLTGTAANEVIIGREGRDIIVSGEGKDVFVYEGFRDLGDVLYDFTSGQDKIDVSGIGLTESEVGFFEVSSRGTYVTFALGPHVRPLLFVVGVDQATLSEPGNIVF